MSYPSLHNSAQIWKSVMVAQTDGEQVYPLCQRIKSKRALGYPHTASMSPGATRVKGSPASTQLDSPAEHPSLPTPPLVYQKVTCDWPSRPWLLVLTLSCLNSNHLLKISWTLPCLPPLCGLFLFWVSSACFVGPYCESPSLVACQLHGVPWHLQQNSAHWNL